MIQTTLQLITPTMAKLYLASNINNRKLDDARIIQYVSEMKNGFWKMNGDPIRFDTTGRLIDGQHRLTAIEKSGITIECLVVTGLDNNVKSTIDVGKNRPTHEQFFFEHSATMKPLDAKTIATAIQIIVLYKNGKTIQLGGAQRDLKTFAVINEFYQKNAANIDMLYDDIKNTTSYRSSILLYSELLAIYFLLYENDAKHAKKFMHELMTGAMLNVGDNLYLLRSVLELSAKNHNNIAYKLQPHERIYTVIKTFLKDKKGIKIKTSASMKWKASKNEQIPVLK